MRNVVALWSIFLPLSWAAQVTLPSLDLSSLGHVAVAGVFSGISLYEDTLQTAAVQSSGAYDGLFLRNSDGVYTSLGQSNGYIYALCAFNTSTLFVGGNFSTIGNVSATNVASYSPSTNKFAALSTGVLGTVNALYCSDNTNQVYIGGSFDMANSTNVIIWNLASQTFESPAFEGLDGTVNTIQGSEDYVLFGGQFDAVSGETSSSTNKPQQINLQTANVSLEIGIRSQGITNNCRLLLNLPTLPMLHTPVQAILCVPVAKMVGRIHGCLKITRSDPGQPPSTLPSVPQSLESTIPTTMVGAPTNSGLSHSRLTEF